MPVDLAKARSRGYFQRANGSQAARGASSRAYVSRWGKPELRGASRVTWRAFEAGVKRGHPPGKKGTRQKGRLRVKTRASVRVARSREVGSERGESRWDEGRFVSERTLQFSLAGVMRGVTLSLSPARRRNLHLSGDCLKRSARARFGGPRELKSQPSIVPSHDRTTPAADGPGPRHGRILGA